MVDAGRRSRRVRERRNEQQQAVAEAIKNHLEEFQSWFNSAAAETKLGLWIDPSEALESVDTLSWPKLKELAKSLQHHQVHREQVFTAVDVMKQSIESPGQSGLVVGALQSGKTGTALCSLFMAPAHYLKTGLTYAPLFITTNQNSHMEQTRQAMRSFFSLYGDIVVGSSAQETSSRSLLEYYSDAGFDTSRKWGLTEITLHEYASNIVDDLYPGVDLISSLVDSFTAKRVHGREIGVKIRNHCERAKERGHGVMMIVDEPQFGASDSRSSFDAAPSKCLLTQILESADDDFFDRQSPNFLVGLSATPFDSYEIEDLFKVRQKIGKGYVGPNAFGGAPIDPSVQGRIPETYGFSTIAKIPGFQPFSEISWLLGQREKPINPEITPTVLDEDGQRRSLTISEKRSYGAKMLRDLLKLMVLGTAKKKNKRVGALLRLAGSKHETETILDDMRVDGPNSPYNVIRFFGDHAEAGADVKRVIAEATANDPRPYLVVVVGKGRMGDAFPQEVEVGIDLSRKPADMNAVLQGVFGRMCGYGKSGARVVVSDVAEKMIKDYVRSNGASETFAKSRHAVTNVIRKGRRTKQNYLHISGDAVDRSPEGSALRKFRSEINAYLARTLPDETDSVKVPKRTDVFFELAGALKRTGLTRYIGKNFAEIDPYMMEAPKIVEPGESSTDVKQDGTVRKLEYTFDHRDPKRCKVLVSRVDAPSSNGTQEDKRRVGRSLTQDLSSTATRHVKRGRSMGEIAPVIEVMKVNANGNRVQPGEPGRFVFAGINFHLEKPVSWRVDADVVTMPTERHAFRGAMSDEEIARQLQTFVAKRLSGRYPPELDQVLGESPCFEIMSRLHNRASHTYYVTDDGIQFVDNESGELDNPNGPAIIEFTSERDPIISYFDQGIEFDENDRDNDLVEEPEVAAPSM